jgi:type II secretory pathway pseudopilin PulG
MDTRSNENRLNRRYRVAAFHLIELLVALALVGVVVAASGTMLLQGFTSEAAYRQQNQAQASARAAVDSLSSDLCGAAVGTISPGTNPPTLASPFSMQVYQDSGATTSKVFYWMTTVTDPNDASANMTTLWREVTPTSTTTPTGAGKVPVAVGKVAKPTASAITSNLSSLVLFPATSPAPPADASKTATIDLTVIAGSANTRSTVRVQTDVVLRNYTLQ